MLRHLMLFSIHINQQNHHTSRDQLIELQHKDTVHCSLKHHFVNYLQHSQLLNCLYVMYALYFNHAPYLPSE
jgi:hypothetical protein